MNLAPFPTRSSLSLLLGSAMLLGACAQTDATQYPSLLPRAIEQRSDAEAVTPVAVAEPDPTLDAKAIDVRNGLDTAQRTFAGAATRAESTARLARGTLVGGDRWLDAQTALAELDVYRADSSGLVTELDELIIARAADGKPPYPALDAARAAAQTVLDEQTTTITRLQASLPES